MFAGLMPQIRRGRFLENIFEKLDLEAVVDCQNS
jgi:hypothetical protein